MFIYLECIIHRINDEAHIRKHLWMISCILEQVPVYNKQVYLANLLTVK